jgi:hypothetical protein
MRLVARLDTDFEDAQSDYRRCARRLRAVHADKPECLQPALLQLAQAMNATRQSVSRSRLDSPAQVFADKIASQLQDGMLRYSQRAALLEESDALGIGPFEANLIIALVQHRARPALDGRTPLPDAPTRHRRAAITFITVALIQSAICAGYWLLAH